MMRHANKKHKTDIEQLNLKTWVSKFQLQRVIQFQKVIFSLGGCQSLSILYDLASNIDRTCDSYFNEVRDLHILS